MNSNISEASLQEPIGRGKGMNDQDVPIKGSRRNNNPHHRRSLPGFLDEGNSYQVSDIIQYGHLHLSLMNVITVSASEGSHRSVLIFTHSF